MRYTHRFSYSVFRLLRKHLQAGYTHGESAAVTSQLRRVVLNYYVAVVVGVQAVAVGGLGGGRVALDLSQYQGAGIGRCANQQILTHVLDGLAVFDSVIAVVQLGGGAVAQNYISKGGAGTGTVDEDQAAHYIDDRSIGGKPVVHVALAIEVRTPLSLCHCQVAGYGLRERSTDG